MTRQPGFVFLEKRRAHHSASCLWKIPNQRNVPCFWDAGAPAKTQPFISFRHLLTKRKIG